MMLEAAGPVTMTREAVIPCARNLPETDMKYSLTFVASALISEEDRLRSSIRGGWESASFPPTIPYRIGTSSRALVHTDYWPGNTV